MNLNPADITNVWQHWWVSRMAAGGYGSRLTPEPLSEAILAALANGAASEAPAPPERPSQHIRRIAREAREEREAREREREDNDEEEMPPLNRAARRYLKHAERAAAKPKPVGPKRPRIAKPKPPPVEVEYPTDLPELPMEPWAKELLGNSLIDRITLPDILDALDQYFFLFAKLRRATGPVYRYFAKTGTPILTKNNMFFAAALDRTTIRNAEKLPGIFGAFIPQDEKKYRETVMRADKDEKVQYFDFHYFEKLAHPPTFAPLGTVIYRHNIVHIDRSYFFNQLKRAERRRHGWLTYNWGMHWLVGILPDGTVKALPQQMTRTQTLPGGDNVYHSAFEIPRWLRDKEHQFNGDPHAFVRTIFITLATVSASVLTGLQVTIRRGDLAVRLGIPISNAKYFFADRLPEAAGERRKPILHLRPAHYRHLADGRVITVGDHLAGQRFFRWRDYDVMVTAPGIHHSTFEAFSGSLWDDESVSAPGVPTTAIDKAAADRAKEWWNPKEKPRFQRGKLATWAWPKDRLTPLSKLDNVPDDAPYTVEIEE